MDNRTNNLIFVDKIEIHPNNPEMLRRMDWFKIASILSNKEYYTTCAKVLSENTFSSSTNFRFQVKNTFVLTNDEAEKYFKHHNYRNDYNYILKQTLISSEILTYYTINHYKDGFHYFVIALGINKKLLDNPMHHEIGKFFRDCLKPTVDVKTTENKYFIRYVMSMMRYHFDEINNIRNDSDENAEISKRITQMNFGYTSQKMSKQPTFIITPLKLYQLANIKWMRNREKSEKRIVLDDTVIVNFGPSEEFNFETVSFQPNRTLETCDSANTNRFLGGCLCDDVGLGKTVQAYTVCLKTKNSSNLIVVPNHLLEHWKDEYVKHVIPQSNFKYVVYPTSTCASTDITKKDDEILIVVTTFDKLNEDIIKNEWTRIMVDEFHEFVGKNDMYVKLCSIKAVYRWAVTATPFINSKMIFNLLNFIAEKKIRNEKIAKYKMFLDVFSDMFRRNTKDSVETELMLPPIKEISYFLEFSDRERVFYDSLSYNNESRKEDLETKKRCFCVNPNSYFIDHISKMTKFANITDLDDNVREMHLKDYEGKKHNIIKRKLEMIQHKITSSIKITYEEDDKTIEEVVNVYKLSKNLDDNKITMIFDYLVERGEFNKQEIKLIQDLEKELAQFKSKINFFENQLKVINGKKMKLETDDGVEETKDGEYTKTDETTDCGLCLDELSDDCTILPCGHIYCTDCISYVIAGNGSNRCPTCKLNLQNAVFYTSKLVKSKETIDLVAKYGTKIAHLINIYRTQLTGQKILVYCYSPSLLDNVVKILNECRIKTTSIYKNDIKTVISNFEKDDTCVLVLSSDDNASGLNITCASAVIMLQPLKGDYVFRKQIENQIVGRLHRIGQNKEISFIRLIIKNSIESDIDKENKLNDVMYQSSGDSKFNPFNLKTTKIEIVK